MRYLELCFHEQDSRLADLASRGLETVGVCVLRRAVSAKHRPGVSPATRHRVILHSAALAALEGALPGLSGSQVSAAVAVPADAGWPQRRSRPWVIVPPGAAPLEAQGFWRLVAWAAQRPLGAVQERLAVQHALLHRLRELRARSADPIGRRRPLAAHINLEPLSPVRGLRDWQSAVTPMAVAGALAGAALFSAFTVGAATRPEAWSAIAQTPVHEPPTRSYLD